MDGTEEVQTGEVIEPRKSKIVVKIANGQLVPEDLDGLWRLAGVYVAAGVGPDVGVKAERRKLNQAEMFTILSYGIAAGLTIPAALNNVYLCNGKPVIYGDGIPSLLLSSGKALYRDGYIGEGEDLTAWAELIRIDARGNPITMPDGTVFSVRREFSIRDARKAELLGKTGPWSTYTKRMLLMRARAWAARDGAADVLQGLGIAEEVEDIPMPVVNERTKSLQEAQAAVAAVAEEARALPAASEAFAAEAAAAMEAIRQERERKKAEPVPAKQSDDIDAAFAQARKGRAA